MPADVIEVDFAASRESDTIEELAEQVDEAFREVADGIADVRIAYEREVRRNADQLDLERRRAARLRGALRDEYDRAFRWTDDEVLQALRNTYAGTPVAASAIAAELDGRSPTHSLRVRTGLALSRLHARGLVQRERAHSQYPGCAYRWSIPSGGGDA